MTPKDKLAAKRFNEKTKLAATAVNAIAVAIFGAAVIIPGVNNPIALLTLEPPTLILVAIGLHFLARAIVGQIRSEE